MNYEYDGVCALRLSGREGRTQYEIAIIFCGIYTVNYKFKQED